MATSEVAIAPEEEEVVKISDVKAVSLEKALTGVNFMAQQGVVMQRVVDIQLAYANGRTTSEQWLDENENEWYHLDHMLASRPWSKAKDDPFPYPFKECTNAMRKAEGPWIGDERTLAPEPSRGWAEGDVLTHVRQPPYYPPGRRVILFTPEFGTPHSYDHEAWKLLQPEDDCDIWICSWQGWTSFEEMKNQVCRKLLSFADGVSTVWYGHSAGALVAYEMLKKFESFHTPNLPVALVVSGCPAPHLFSSSYKPSVKFPWLKKIRFGSDFDNLEWEQIQVLVDEFQMAFEEMPSQEQRSCFCGDSRLLSKYRCNHKKENLKLADGIPILAFSSDGDSLVSRDSVEAWSECSAEGFEMIDLSEGDNSESVCDSGHGYAWKPVDDIIRKINEWGSKWKLEKDLNKLLALPKCDVGPTDGDMPDKIGFLVVGAGIMGVNCAADAVANGIDTIVLDRYKTIGGIWSYYANKYSQVNSSEIGYRLVTQTGAGSRPNKDHSPKHDILRDIYTVAARAKGCFRLQKDVTKVEKNPDATYTVHIKCLATDRTFKVIAKSVTFAVNRRIGKRRDVAYPNEDKFLGENRYGYANEVLGLDFWGKRTIVVGAGAFAFENLRTSLEHGARHCTILGRRAGTTSPKWIDIIAYLRPTDENFVTNRVANALSFECWRKCYTDAHLPTPECWDEGLLKPHNHTVSVSDIAFIGGHHRMVDLDVGEIKTFMPSGDSVKYFDGREKLVDIIIKSTGFHLQDEVPKICGNHKMFPWGQLDFNMFYQAEPLLDGGQFGSSKGKMGDETGELQAQMDMWVKGAEKFREMGLPDILTPKANPFGSGYMGYVLQQVYFQTWLLQNEEQQKEMFEWAGEPPTPAHMMWASAQGAGMAVINQRLVKSILEADPV